MKNRLDTLLVERGMFPSREKAKASIMAGLIYVDGQISDKAGTMIDTDAQITIKENLCPYVSRGGLKLEKAMELWAFHLEHAVCMDIGASTGGFTDCMLQKGAQKVYAVDVGYGQLDYKLRNDCRVVNMEKQNIRYIDTAAIDPLDFISVDVSFISLKHIFPVAAKMLKDRGKMVCLIKPQFEAGREQVGKKGIVRDTAAIDPLDFISVDVSFISLKHIFPVAAKMLKDRGKMVCLIKPQFEAGREQVGKKGIVRDRKVHIQVIENVIKYSLDNGLAPVGLTFSPVTGAKGNIEFLLYIDGKTSQTAEAAISHEQIEKIVDASHEELE